MRLQDGTIRHRRHSFNLPGHAHELTFSCHEGLRLLNKDRTRLWFLAALELARVKHGLHLWAYVIMPEHVHVLLLPLMAHYEMAAILKTIKQSLSRRAVHYLRKRAPLWLDDRLAVYRGEGCVEYHFWREGGGYDRNIVTVEAVHASVEYIHNNPVRRGLVESSLDWPWSSARWYAGEQDVKLAMDETLPWIDG